MSARSASRLATKSARRGPNRPRTLAVLRYLPSPISQDESADQLFVSLNTVKTHSKAMYRNLTVSDRKAAVQAARDAGLL